LLNSLSGADKRFFEQVLGMGSGYVLDFTNESFERFFNDYGVDIYGDKYDLHGPSKARRLRAFLDLEPDELLGQVLLGILELSISLDRDSPEFRRSYAIAARLTEKSLVENDNDVLQESKQQSKIKSEIRKLDQLWNGGPIRVFISHVARYKKDAEKIQNALAGFGIASFVAHKDIEPSEDWQAEIIRALSSMNLFIALVTEGFKESDWTDQETGFAVARRVPILPVSRGMAPYGFFTPYGFVAKIQALRWDRSSADEVAKKTMEMALKDGELESFAKTAFIESLAGSKKWAETNRLSHVLPFIDSLTSDEADWFVDVYNSNSQVYESWGIQGIILDELGRMTGHTYVFDNYRRLQKEELPKDIPS